MIMRTCCGVALYRIDMINELSITLLPEPVDPAISKCGIASSAATLIRPLISFPNATVSGDGELINSSDSRICRSAITSRFEFGTSMPTVGFPGMRSIRIDSAWRPRHRSSLRVVMRVYFTPASGLNSNVVTTGPGLICTTDPKHVELLKFGLDLRRGFLQFLAVVGRSGSRLLQQVRGRLAEFRASPRRRFARPPWEKAPEQARVLVRAPVPSLVAWAR